MLWRFRLDESRGGPERRERLGGQLGRRQRRGRLLGAAQVGAGESGRRHGAVLVSLRLHPESIQNVIIIMRF